MSTISLSLQYLHSFDGRILKVQVRLMRIERFERSWSVTWLDWAPNCLREIIGI